MSDFFDSDYNGESFTYFSQTHFAALIILFCVYLMLFAVRKNLSRSAMDKKVRLIIAILLILQELSLNIWRTYNGIWHISTSLPLHLCGIAVVLSALMLVSNNYRLYEINYFWGLGGAIQALLTPDIGLYGFPHFRFFQFFASHGLIVLATLYMTFVAGYRPEHRSVWRVFAITNIYMVFIAGFNMLTGGNYLFICSKPENGSLMDFMGPWPWYILTLEVVGIFSFYLYYSPVAVSKLFTRKLSANTGQIQDDMTNG